MQQSPRALRPYSALHWRASWQASKARLTKCPIRTNTSCAARRKRCCISARRSQRWAGLRHPLRFSEALADCLVSPSRRPGRSTRFGFFLASLSGMRSPLYSRGRLRCSLFSRLSRRAGDTAFAVIAKPTAAGFIMGGIAAILPNVLFSGEVQTHELVSDWSEAGAFVLLATGVLKLAITPMYLNMGWSGGISFRAFILA